LFLNGPQEGFAVLLLEVNKCFDTQEQATAAEEQDKQAQSDQPGKLAPVLRPPAQVSRNFLLSIVDTCPKLL